MTATVYLCAGAVAVLNGIVAGLCARSRAFDLYLGILAVTACSAFLCLSLPFSGHESSRQVVVNFLWAVPIPDFFGLIPGLLVRKGTAFGLTLGLRHRHRHCHTDFLALRFGTLMRAYRRLFVKVAGLSNNRWSGCDA